MSKPFERNRLKRRYLYLAICSYALIVLFFCHWGYLVQSAPELSGASLALEAVNHLVFHPFQFFPFDTAYLAYGMLIGLIAADRADCPADDSDRVSAPPGPPARH